MFSWNLLNSIKKNLPEGFKPCTFCVGDQSATTVPARHA